MTYIFLQASRSEFASGLAYISNLVKPSKSQSQFPKPKDNLGSLSFIFTDLNTWHKNCRVCFSRATNAKSLGSCMITIGL